MVKQWRLIPQKLSTHLQQETKGQKPLLLRNETVNKKGELQDTKNESTRVTNFDVTNKLGILCWGNQPWIKGNNNKETKDNKHKQKHLTMWL